MALSADQYTALKLNLRALASANRYTVANLSESDLLGFWNQLATDSAGATPLSATQDAAVDRMFRSLLCSSGNVFLGLADADWATFFSQLGTDSTSATPLPTAQYSALKLQLRALLSGGRASPPNLSEADLLSYLNPRIGTGTPLTIITSVPVRLWLRADLGVTVVTGVSSWVDQSANAYDHVQATAAQQPTRSLSDATLNNRATITGDGVNDYLAGTATTMTASYWRATVAKYNAFAVNDRALDIEGGKCTWLGQGSPNVILFQSSGNTANNGGFGSTGTWKRTIDQQSNATTDKLQIGSVTRTGAALGRVASSTQFHIFGSFGAFYASAAFAEIIITDGIPTVGEQTAIDTYLSNRYLASILT